MPSILQSCFAWYNNFIYYLCSIVPGQVINTSCLRTLHVVWRKKFAKYSRKIREKFAKYSRKIREKFTKNLRKNRKKIAKNQNLLIFHDFFTNFSRILIFCDFFAIFSQIFRKFFAYFSRIFRKFFAYFSRIFREFFGPDHVKSPLLIHNFPQRRLLKELTQFIFYCTLFYLVERQ